MKKSLKSTILGITAGITALAFSNCSTTLQRTNSVDPLYNNPKTENTQYVTQKEYNSLDSVVDSEKNYFVDTSKNEKSKENIATFQGSQTQTYPNEKHYSFYDFDNDGIVDWNDPWPHRYGPFVDMNNNHIVDFQDWQISGFSNPMIFDYQSHSSSWYFFDGEDYMSSAWFWKEPMIGWNFSWSSWSNPWTHSWRWNNWNYSYPHYFDNYYYGDYYENYNLEDRVERRRKPSRSLRELGDESDKRKIPIREYKEKLDNDRDSRTRRYYRDTRETNEERSRYIRIRKNSEDLRERQRNTRSIERNSREIRKNERPKRRPTLKRELNNQRIRKSDDSNFSPVRNINTDNNSNRIRNYNNSNSSNSKSNSNSTRTRKSNSSNNNSNSGRKKR